MCSGVLCCSIMWLVKMLVSLSDWVWVVLVSKVVRVVRMVCMVVIR